MTPGAAVYLNITGYQTTTVVCNTPEESIPRLITVNIFDGGNNMLAVDAARRTVTAQAYGLPPLSVSGTTAVTDQSGVAVWQFPATSITLASQTVGSYGLQFTSPVGRCTFTDSNPALKAPEVSALEATIR